MESQRSDILVQSKTILNEYQNHTLLKFESDGLKNTDFVGRDWFNNYYHHLAFSFLVKKRTFL